MSLKIEPEETKKYLESYKEARHMAEIFRRQLARYEKEAEDGTLPRMKRLAADRSAERAYGAVVELETACGEIEMLLAQTEMRPIMREILVGRYVEGETWSALAERLCYSEIQLHRLHKLALIAVGYRREA